ncbi:MAG: DUF1906 domain-containing protein [Gemmatimonadetes bacterium]|nr:DUF1906 domain-containing protein [Gemmatimonadota bacterium]
MNGKNLLLAALVLLFGACTQAPRLPTGALPTPMPGARPQGVPGFDTGRYPGEATMRAWYGSSPYRWVGYYLPSPCHRDASWAGTRATLARIGWGMAVLYVGQQAFENQTAPDTLPPERIICSRTLLTVERARADAADAVARTAADGFPTGTVIFLDVERMQEIPPAMVIYYQAWHDAVIADGRFRPGTYAHRVNAAALYALAQTAYLRAGRRESPPFWISGGTAFSLDKSPTASGFPFAGVWQGVLDVRRTFAGITLLVDENVAARQSPSAP